VGARDARRHAVVAAGPVDEIHIVILPATSYGVTYCKPTNSSLLSASGTKRTNSLCRRNVRD